MIDYVSLVNPRQGTSSQFNFSNGNTLPLVSRPFGMTSWTPQTAEDNWIFHPHARQLQGIRATHQPSPWMGDYGHFTLMPQTGPLMLSATERACAFRTEELHIAPHRLQVRLRRYRATLTVAPTERCAAFSCSFDAAHQARLILQPGSGDSAIDIDCATGEVRGFTRSNSGGVPANFACYFVLRLDRPFVTGGTFAAGEIEEGKFAGEGERCGGYVEFQVEPGEVVEWAIATSFISHEQALLTLEREIGTRTVDEVAAQGQTDWNDWLSRVEIEGASLEQQRTFYSCFYRTGLFPRQWFEYNEQGAPHHFSPYDGELHPGTLYSDNGFWDTYRTVYPWLALVAPDRLEAILAGWVQGAREGGWFPRWASPGFRDCMTGTHSDAVFADALAKDIPFDLATVWKISRRNAFEVASGSDFGRKGLREYIELGYVPCEIHESVSRTLDYAYGDFCLSRLAEAVGACDDACQLQKRARSYRRVFDPEVGFMRGKGRDGEWLEPFSEFTWGGPYVEGGPWQSSWGVPHDPAGLIALYGGATAFCARLDEMLAREPHFEVGTYPHEIHEMTEMAAVNFGQYAHSNQPVHHVLYLYAAAGQPWKTQYWVRRVLDELYDSGETGFCGDEDNGEMSAWYLLSALGIFPLCPGTSDYVVGTPLFPKATIRTLNGQGLVIEAEGGGPGRPYVEKVELDGLPFPDIQISHQMLRGSGHLKLKMSATPPQK